jgi:hypothetical protein
MPRDCRRGRTARLLRSRERPTHRCDRGTREDGAVAGTRAADASNIAAHIAALSLAGNGRSVFTLDNGQIWLQLLTEGDLLLKAGDTVKISRAAFNSYWLQTQSGRGCKVTRIR